MGAVFDKHLRNRTPQGSEQQRKRQAMLEIASEVDWRFRLALILADKTAYRIGSIRRPRRSDLDLEEEVAR